MEPNENRIIFGWSMYDWANSAFTTLVVTFIYSTYFTKAIAENEIIGTAYWSRGITFSAIAVALLSPVLGALADRGGLRKRFLFLSTILCVVFTAVLYLIKPGAVFMALTCFIIANIAFEMGMVFYNAFLPDVSTPENIGRVSGYGWALGYAGGLICMFLALIGFVNPETPWFGFSKVGGDNIRATNLLVAVWFAVFSIPTFIFLKDKKREHDQPINQMIVESFQQLASTFREVRKYSQIARFLLARLLYNDGLITIFAFGGIYAAGTFGFSWEEIMYFGVSLNVAAGIGAFCMGFLDDRIGGKRMIIVSLCGLTLGTFIALVGQSKLIFWIAGMLIGFFAGPNQSGSRALLGRLIPKEMEGEFYGFFAFSGKATAFLAPLLLGILTEVSKSQRIGFSVILIFFLIGGFLLLGVKERKELE